MGTVVYTHPSLSIRLPAPHGAGHSQRITIPVTSGTPTGRVVSWTFAYDYNITVGGVAHDPGRIEMYGNPTGTTTYTDHQSLQQSSSGSAVWQSQPVPLGTRPLPFAYCGLFQAYSHQRPGDTFTATVTLTHIVITVTTQDTSVPTDPPLPPGGGGGALPYYALEVLNKPTLASGQSIAGNIEQVWSPSGNRDLTGVSVFKIEIVTPAAQDTPIAVAFAVVGGSSAQTKTATMVSGVAAFNEPLNTALPAGEYRYRIECTSNCIVNKAVIRSPLFYYRGAGTTDFRYLEFNPQPPDTATIGTAMPNVVVKSVNDAGTVQTGTQGTCTVVNFSLSSVEKDTNLQGTKTVTFLNGLATYTGLIHVQPGRYFLKANASVTTHRENWSEVTNASGDAPTMPGLRQMHSEDANWRTTTGLAPPTFATLTADQLQILDGDVAVTAKVTCEGLRNVFVKPMFLRKVLVKYKVSSLAALPTIKVYTSVDSTDPTAGTWTILATLTPLSTKVEIRSYLPSAAVYTTGLWVTLDKNGGAATCDWYSVQVVGDYVKPDFSVTSLNTGEVDEDYLSIPSPMRNLQGAQTVTRDIIITNNTAVDKATIVQAVAARYGGDPQVDGEITVREPTTGAIVHQKAFPAGAGHPLQLRYQITAADNDLSGLHYIKVKLKDYTVAFSHFWAVSSVPDWVLANVATGATVVNVPRITIAHSFGTPAVGTHDPYVYLFEYHSGTFTVFLRRLLATTGAVVGQFTIRNGTGTNGSLFIFHDTLFMMNASVTSSVAYMIPNLSTVPNDTVLEATALATFPATEKFFSADSTEWIVIDREAPTFVCLKNASTNGGQLISYSPDLTAAGQHWQVDLAHRTHANFGAVLSRAYCFDEMTGRIYRFRAPAGGVIGVEGYPTPGGSVTTPVEADTYLTINGSLGDPWHAFTLGTKIYVLFARRYLWTYDLPNFTNPTQLWDHGSNFIERGRAVTLFDF